VRSLAGPNRIRVRCNKEAGYKPLLVGNRGASSALDVLIWLRDEPLPPTLRQRVSCFPKGVGQNETGRHCAGPFRVG
jgi:hypothetical protein